MKPKTIAAMIIFLLMFIIDHSMASTYYVSKNGNDNNTGTSWSSAWLSTVKVQNTFRGGDTVFFGTGIWRNVSISAPSGGTATDRTAYACSAFVQGITQWWGSEQITGWNVYSGQVYRVSHGATSPLYCVAQGDSILTAVSSLSGVNSQGKFFHDQAAGMVYVWAWGGGDPDLYDMEISDHAVIRFEHGSDYSTIWGITLKYSENHCLVVRGGGQSSPSYVYIDHVKATHCASDVNINVSPFYFGTSGTTNYLDNSRYSRIRACSADFAIEQFGNTHNNAGYYSYGMTYCVMESSWSGPHAKTGVYIKGQSSAGFTNYGNSFRYNYFSPVPYYAIHMHTNGWADSIYGNIIVSNGATGIYLEDQSPDYAGGHHRIYNNTFINCGNAINSGGDYCCEPIIDKMFKYNVIYRPSGSGNTVSIPSSDTVQWDIDNNLYYGSGMTWNGANFTTWRGRGFDVNGVSGINPGFANPGAGDYSRPGSSPEMNLNYAGQTWTRYGAWQPPAGPDVTPPVISLVRSTDTTTSSIYIRWSTNEFSTSRVEYGLTTSYGSFTNLDQTMVITHAQNITGLASSTTYHYRVISRDAAGNEAMSGDFTFRTLAPDNTPPTFTGIGAQSITPTSATIIWFTNESSTSQVNYGLTTSYGSTTTLDPSLVVAHGVGLTGLTPNTLYHYRVRSRDAAGNEGVSGDYTFQSDTVVTLQLISVGVPVAVCGTYAGYNPARINDGVADPRGGTATTWASDSDSVNAHWIEVSFSAPRQVRRARILWAWNNSNSNWMCSQQYILQHWDTGSSAFVNSAIVNNSSGDSITITDFTPVTTNRIRYWQPPNMGPATYRRVIWFTEFELYGSNSGQDTIPPDDIQDLGAVPSGIEGSIELNWTAPSARDGALLASRYDIRYFTEPITESNWAQARAVPNPPAPNMGGVYQWFTVTGLPPGEVYSLAIKSYDDAWNVSALSNITSSYSAGISPPLALDTRVSRSTESAVLVGGAIRSYLSVYYEFALDTVEAFSNARMGVSLLADSTVTCLFDSLSTDGHYYWRFRAVASDRSHTSAWSNVLNFDYLTGIGPAITGADCLFPSEGTTVRTSRPIFSVRSVPDVVSVYIQVADDTGFGSPIESGPIFATSGNFVWKISEPLREGAAYYWRASADNATWTNPIVFGAEVDIHPYPNPFRASDGVQGVTFVNLPGNSKVTIATVSGNVVLEAEGVGPDEWLWDTKNSGGDELASGVYLYSVNFPDGSSSGKVMIIR
jgi:hypothetical protein